MLRRMLFLSMMFIALSGCGASQQELSLPVVEPVIVDTELGALPQACLDTAERAVALLRAQKWHDFRQLFRSDIQNYLTDDVLKQIWFQFISPSGAYVETIARDVIVQSHDISVEVITRFENKVLLTFFSFDLEGRIAAFQFPLHEDAQKWGKCYLGCIYEAERFSDAFRNRDWQALRQQLSPKLAQELSDADLDAQYERIFSQLGPLVTFFSRHPETKDGKRHVTHVTKYVHGMLVFSITFDQDARIEAYHTEVIPNSVPTNVQDASETEDSEHYTVEHVTFSAVPTFMIDARLTVPKGQASFPVVVLLSGSGPQDMDETIGPNKPFKDIADGLAKRGIATLRFTKRTATYGTKVEPTIENEYLDDLSAALAFVSADARLGKKYVLGHSLGGCLMPAVAALHPTLDGIISVAGSLRPLDEIATDQLRHQLEIAKATLAENEYEELKKQIEPMIQDLAIVAELPDDIPDEQILFMVPAKYWRSLKRYAASEYLSQIKMPFLIVQGDGDIQVSREKDYALWEAQACPLDHVTCKLYDGLNHLMMPTQGFKNGEEYTLPAVVSEAFIQDLANFILE